MIQLEYPLVFDSDDRISRLFTSIYNGSIMVLSHFQMMLCSCYSNKKITKAQKSNNLNMTVLQWLLELTSHHISIKLTNKYHLILNWGCWKKMKSMVYYHRLFIGTIVIQIDILSNFFDTLIKFIIDNVSRYSLHLIIWW